MQYLFTTVRMYFRDAVKKEAQLLRTTALLSVLNLL